MTTPVTQPTTRPVPWGAFALLILVLAGMDALQRGGVAGPLAMFGRSEQTMDTASFGQASAVAVFGGASLDLRRATIAKDGAVLRANAAFGRVRVRVPAGWRVETHGIGILGQYRNETRRPETAGPVLRVEGMALFGQVRIEN